MAAKAVTSHPELQPLLATVSAHECAFEYEGFP